MKRYSAERKASVIEKMMPPHNTPIPELAKETDICDVTLYNWRKQARLEGLGACRQKVGEAIELVGKHTNDEGSEHREGRCSFA